MSKIIEELVAPNSDVRPGIYAYSIADDKHKGPLKVGRTLGDMRQWVAELLNTAAIKAATASARDDHDK